MIPMGQLIIIIIIILSQVYLQFVGCVPRIFASHKVTAKLLRKIVVSKQ